MRSFIFLTLCAAGLFAQAPAVKPEDYGLISGKVLNSLTREPVRKATVRLMPQEKGFGELTVQTDGGGGFTAVQLRPGEYRLRASANSYVGMEDDISMDVKLAPGSQKTDLAIKLVPQCVVTGRVLDEDGDPVRGADVRAVPVRRRLGMGTEARGGDSTNDLGEFRLTDLRPGTYLLTANHSSYASRDDGRPPSAFAVEEQINIRTFHPSTTDLGAAMPVRLAAGSEMRGMEIRLRKTKALRVTGKVEGFPQEKYTTVEVERLGPLRFGWEHFGRPRVQEDGSFTLSGLVPGEYLLSVAVQTGKRYDPETMVRGSALVRVDNSSVEGVLIRPNQMIAITGVLRGEGLKTDPKRHGVRLSSKHDSYRWSDDQKASVDATGRFTLSAPDADFVVSATGLEDDQYLKDASFEGRDVLKEGLRLTAPGELVLTVGTDGGKVTGTVEVPEKQPRQDMRVLLWPGGEERGARHRNRAGTVKRDGTFELNGVAPGRYRVIAIPVLDGDYDALLSESYLKILQDKSETLEVAARASVQKQLKLVPLTEFE